jgi:hypothetical protein
MAANTLFATSASAQSARDIRGPSPLVAIENKAPAKLIVDPPLPEPLARGLVFIPRPRIAAAHLSCSKAEKTRKFRLF